MNSKVSKISLAMAGVALVAFLLVFRPSASAQVASGGLHSGVVWYGVLEDGLAEAKSTNKPILLLSAAPNCVGVSGMW